GRLGWVAPVRQASGRKHGTDVPVSGPARAQPIDGKRPAPDDERQMLDDQPRTAQRLRLFGTGPEEPADVLHVRASSLAYLGQERLLRGAESFDHSGAVVVLGLVARILQRALRPGVDLAVVAAKNEWTGRILALDAAGQAVEQLAAPRHDIGGPDV